MTVRTKAIVGLVLIATCCSNAGADPLSRAKDRVPGDAQQHHVFELTYQADETSMSAQVDTARPEGKRVTVNSSTVEDEDEQERLVKEMDRAAGRGYWCDDVLDGVPEDARVLAQTDTTVTYAFAPQPTGERNDAVLEHLDGEIGLDRASAQVVSYRLTAPKPFRQALVAKITTFEMAMDCVPAPNGRTFAASFEMSVQGSAAFKKFSQAFSRQLKLIERPTSP